ncbi:hypothetical protein LXA43DRAFT_416585 [Ganoderma leucocontextum]|nr:hypothetical protein LXA43DRAFT_416585 [Ganoderma leucocontextum]
MRHICVFLLPPFRRLTVTTVTLFALPVQHPHRLCGLIPRHTCIPSLVTTCLSHALVFPTSRPLDFGPLHRHTALTVSTPRQAPTPPPPIHFSVSEIPYSYHRLTNGPPGNVCVLVRQAPPKAKHGSVLSKSVHFPTSIHFQQIYTNREYRGSRETGGRRPCNTYIHAHVSFVERRKPERRETGDGEEEGRTDRNRLYPK